MFIVAINRRAVGTRRKEFDFPGQCILQIDLLEETDVVAADQPVDVMRFPLRADVKLKTEDYDVAFRGPQTEAQLRQLYSKASIYVATSRYEPFGLAAVEAAFSRCALIVNDIPTFHELWGDTAYYFRCNDAQSLGQAIERLHCDRELRLTYANMAYQRARQRFTADRMVEDYIHLYQTLVPVEAAAASLLCQKQKPQRRVAVGFRNPLNQLRTQLPPFAAAAHSRAVAGSDCDSRGYI